MKTEHKYYTISAPDPRYTSNGWTVYGWGTYPRSSVLAGQPRKCFIISYDTLELAQAAFPKANQSSKWTEPSVSLAHLPDADGSDPYGDNAAAAGDY